MIKSISIRETELWLNKHALEIYVNSLQILIELLFFISTKIQEGLLMGIIYEVHC